MINEVDSFFDYVVVLSTVIVIELMKRFFSFNKENKG